MKLSPLVLVLVGVAAFILLHFLARRYRPFSHSLGAVCAITGRLLVTLAYHMQRAISYCGLAIDKALQSISDTNVWTMRDFLWRLSGFDIGFLILAGESILVVEVLPSLFQAATVTLPPIFELSSAALFICCSALFGDIVLECWGKIRGVGLFHNMGKPSRWIVGVLAFGALLFSCVVNFYFYIYRGEILAHQSVSGMAIYLMGGLGLEVSAAAPFALLAVKEGSLAVLVCLLWLVKKFCEAIHAFATFIPDLLDTIALHLSSGEVGVWGKQIERPAHKFPPLNGGSYRPVDVVEVPSEDDGEVTQPVQPKLLPEPGKMEVIVKNQPFKTASLNLAATSRLLEVVKREIATLNAAGSILSSSVVDYSVSYMPTGLDASIIDCSPSALAKKQAVMASNNNPLSAYAALFDATADSLVEPQIRTQAEPGAMIFCAEKSCIAVLCPALEKLHLRLPLHGLLLHTHLSSEDLQDENIVHGLRLAVELYKMGALQKIIVEDDRGSRFALSYGRMTQQAFWVRGLLSFLLTHRHTLSQASFNDLLKRDLRPGGPFASVSYNSQPLALGELPARFKLFGMSGKQGRGDINDIHTQVAASIKHCVEDSSCTSWSAGVDKNLAAIAVTDVPLALTDTRFMDVVARTSRFVNANFPHIHGQAVVSGNGQVYPTELASRFNVQSTLIYTIPDILPGETEELEDDSGTRVFTLVPLPTDENEKPVAASRNGNGHTKSRAVAHKSSRTRKSAGGK